MCENHVCSRTSHDKHLCHQQLQVAEITGPGQGEAWEAPRRRRRGDKLARATSRE